MSDTDLPEITGPVDLPVLGASLCAPKLCVSWVAHKNCKFAGVRQDSDLPCSASDSKHAICNWRVRASAMVKEGVL